MVIGTIGAGFAQKYKKKLTTPEPAMLGPSLPTPMPETPTSAIPESTQATASGKVTQTYDPATQSYIFKLGNNMKKFIVPKAQLAQLGSNFDIENAEGDIRAIKEFMAVRHIAREDVAAGHEAERQAQVEGAAQQERAQALAPEIAQAAAPIEATSNINPYEGTATGALTQGAIAGATTKGTITALARTAAGAGAKANLAMTAAFAYGAYKQMQNQQVLTKQSADASVSDSLDMMNSAIITANTNPQLGFKIYDEQRRRIAEAKSLLKLQSKDPFFSSKSKAGLALQRIEEYERKEASGAADSYYNRLVAAATNPNPNAAVTHLTNQQVEQEEQQLPDEVSIF